MGSPKPRSRLWRLLVGGAALTGFDAVLVTLGRARKAGIRCLQAFCMLCCGLCSCGRCVYLHAFGKVEALSLDPDGYFPLWVSASLGLFVILTLGRGQGQHQKSLRRR